MRQGFRVLGILAVFTLFTACESLSDFVMKPDVSVSHVRPTSITFNDITLEVELEVYNPNPISLELDGYDYDFLVEGSTFLKGELTEKVGLEAFGTTFVKIPLTVEFLELYESINALSDSTESAYEIVMGLHVDIPVLGMQRLALSHEGTIPHVRAPRFSFDSVHLENLSISGAEVVLLLNAKNPNGFDMSLNDFQGDFVVNQKKWSSLQSLEPVSFPSGESAGLGFRFTLDFINMGRSLYNLIQDNDSLSYSFNGEILLGSSLDLLEEATLPLNLGGDVPLTKPENSGSNSSLEESLKEGLDSLFKLF